MTGRLRLRFFAHSWRSDWNHGNAHFLRGLVDELRNRGHEVRCYEEENAWSFVNLLDEELAAHSLHQFRSLFPDLDVRTYSSSLQSDLEDELQDADVVIIHEWNAPELAQRVLALRRRYGFKVLFHDTHHRSYTRPDEIGRFPIPEFDGVLAFGEGIRRIYKEAFNASKTWTFHEAADTARFHPRGGKPALDVNWIGNWGDGERTRELQEFLIEPIASLRLQRAAVYGVRFSNLAKQQLRAAGIAYRGYLPNLEAPHVYSCCALTLHIPRRCYSNGLSGIPTIRMFEAFACGIPLICSPWSDVEGLFNPNDDFITVSSGDAMKAEISHLLRDEEARQQLSRNALSTIHRRHTCSHRALQFEEICGELGK
jgi:spore maturation protein CgeB